MLLPLTTRFGANPLLDLELANKAYVDSAPSGKTFGFAMKAADQTVTSSEVLINDDDLFIALNANKTYYYRMFLALLCASSTPDLKDQMVAPAGATGNFNESQGTSNSQLIDLAIVQFQGHTGSPTAERSQSFEGYIFTAGTAGNLQLTWAQNTSNANGMTLKQGSTLLVWEIPV